MLEAPPAAAWASTKGVETTSPLTSTKRSSVKAGGSPAGHKRVQLVAPPTALPTADGGGGGTLWRGASYNNVWRKRASGTGWRTGASGEGGAAGSAEARPSPNCSALDSAKGSTCAQASSDEHAARGSAPAGRLESPRAKSMPAAPARRQSDEDPVAKPPLVRA
jgi:hypothetical protein